MENIKAYKLKVFQRVINIKKFKKIQMLDISEQQD